MDYHKLHEKLNKISHESRKEDTKFKTLVQHVSSLDETKESFDILYDTLNEDEKHYHMMNENYKTFISGYSQGYLKMSDWYYGPELPHDIYCKLFDKGTFLDNKKNMEELYLLFIFMFLFDYEMRRFMINSPDNFDTGPD
jgi:hypothetical protein